jgi:hypothetical protein
MTKTAPGAVRLARPEVGIDSYRAAKILIGQHGAEAGRVASQRMQALLEKGDEAGAAAWVDIHYATGELLRGRRPSEVPN